LKEIMEDKRAYERFDLEVPANIEFARSDQDEMDLVSLKTINISAGGAFFRTDDLLPPGTRVKLDLTLSIEKLNELLDSHCRIKVEGEVIRSEDLGIAIKFDDNYEIMPVKRELQ
jgi:hypothetical protein